MGLERHQSCGLRWLSDGEQGGVRGGAWAVKRAEEEERGGGSTVVCSSYRRNRRQDEGGSAVKPWAAKRWWQPWSGHQRSDSEANERAHVISIFFQFVQNRLNL
jgi:hypothetical protein